MQIKSPSLVVLLGVSPLVVAQDPIGNANRGTVGPMERMDHACGLVDQGLHEEALKELLWCFDEGDKGGPAFFGVRLSFLLSRIAELGKQYPPALQALRERRDAAEVRAAETKGTLGYTLALMDFAALNHSLNDDAANLELYDRLRAEQPDSPLLGFLRNFVADELVRRGRVDEADATPAEIGERPQGEGVPQVVARAWPRPPEELPEGTQNMRSTGPYTLDQRHFKQEIGTAKDEQQRLDVLKRRWNEVVLAAAYCHVMSDIAFHESVSYWQSGWLSTGTWTVASDGDLTAPPGPMSKATVLVRGDCRADITINGLVHVYGDLASRITATGHSEVVVGGDIRPNGSIEGDGVTRVFIGGNLEGQISNRGSSIIWVNGDLDGEVRAGRPSTHLHVMGDVRGSLKPLGPAALAYLDVRGMMSSEKVETVARHGWTEFNASIGTSDVPPGLYPKSQTANGFWIVHSRRP